MNNKIVIVSNTSWNLYNFRLHLMNKLKENNYEVIAVAPYDEYSNKLEHMGFKYYNIKIVSKSTNPINDFKIIVDFYKLYKKIKPSIVLNYTIKPNIYGTISCSLLGIKTINNISGLGTLFIKNSIATKVAILLYKFSQKKANKVFFQNMDDFNLFVYKYKLINSDKCKVLPGSGVDTSKFRPIKFLKNSKVFKFLLIARMLYDKGIGEYVRAAEILNKKYDNIEFQLLGPLIYDNKTAVSKKDIELWEKSTFINYLGSTDNVKSYITKADCIVLPSYREGTPKSLLEAASMEKPIVTTNAVGCKDVVDDGINGFLCKVKDSYDLADKMEKVFELSYENRLKMGKAGRKKIIENYDINIVTNLYIETIESL